VISEARKKEGIDAGVVFPIEVKQAHYKLTSATRTLILAPHMSRHTMMSMRRMVMRRPGADA
jgi:hypothetical protein